MAEMRDPSRDFVPALYCLQGFAITIYTIVGAIIYALAGEHTTSPALGSAPGTSAKIAYGIVFVSHPGLENLSFLLGLLENVKSTYRMY
jgi:amino acid permease